MERSENQGLGVDAPSDADPRGVPGVVVGCAIDMRRAFVVPALVALTGACSRPNPGFEVGPPPVETTTAAETTTGESTGVPPTTTTSGESTTTEPITSDPSTTTTTISSDPGEASSSGESSTGEMTVEWPIDCAPEDRIVSEREVAVTDTFFLSELYFDEMQTCSFGGPEHCQDIDLGATDFFQLAFDNSTNDDPLDDFASVYAARFPMPQPEYEGLPVKHEGWLFVQVTVHLVHKFDDPNPWAPMAFDVYRFAEGDVWSEGLGFGPTACVSPGASFRCRECPVENPDGACKVAWADEFPFIEGENTKLVGVKVMQDPGEGVDVTMNVPVDDFMWLVEEGMLLVPQSPLKANVLEIKTKDYDQGALGPFLSVVHCPPIIGP